MMLQWDSSQAVFKFLSQAVHPITHRVVDPITK